MTDFTELQTRLPHLPGRKQRELALAAGIILDGFAKITAYKTKKELREGKILKITLFGSYARGGWVEDYKGGYFSDYDILIVVNNELCAEPEYWYDLHDRFDEEYAKPGGIKTQIGFIVHSYDDINSQLAVGRPFFMDIMQDGISLYDAGNCPFVKPGKMTARARREQGQKYFAELYERSLIALEVSKISFSKARGKMGEYMRKAAFDAHQATENIYHCLLLSLTLYSPKLHDLRKLCPLAHSVAPELVEIWPRDTKFHKRCFARLWRAYVEARYSPHYEISAEELEWIYTQIEALQSRAKAICSAKLQ